MTMGDIAEGQASNHAETDDIMMTSSERARHEQQRKPSRWMTKRERKRHQAGKQDHADKPYNSEKNVQFRSEPELNKNHRK